jgi:polyferredoxin
MNDTVDSQNNESIWKSLLWCLPMVAVTLLLLSKGRIPSSGAQLFAFAAAFLFFNAVFFQVIHSRKTYRLRSAVFITYALCFVVSFIGHLIEERGSMAISEADMIEGLVPFCHIVIPMTIIPAALTKTIIFPGTIVGTSHAIAGMFALWIGSSLSLGRGFCSWFCFFGGMDEGFSRIGKKPILKNIDKKWTYLPYAILLLVVIGAAVTLAPVYCEWLCPFKTVTEYAEVVSVKTLIQAVIFVSLFLALVIVLPVLTKRRTQCSLFCPLGAFQSFTNKLNAFEVRVDTGKCVQCGICVRECPTFSLDTDGIAQGKTALTCVKCGKCVDTCPKKAPYFHIKGTPLASNGETKRRLFLYPAFIFLFTMAGGFTQDAIIRVIRLVTTGSMI